MGKRTGSAIKFVLTLMLAAVLLWFAFRKLDWKEFFGALESTKWFFVILSVIPSVLALIFRAERWRLQLKPLDDSISSGQVWHSSNIGNLLNVILSGSGEFFRCGGVTTRKATYDKVFGTIFIERMWDVAAILLLLVLATFTGRDALIPFIDEHIMAPLHTRLDGSLVYIIAGVIVLLAAALLLILRFRDRSHFCQRCYEAFTGIITGVKSFSGMSRKWRYIAYTVGIWTMYILVTWFTFLAIPGLSFLTFKDAVFISAIGNIASIIPTPGNLGAYHYLVGIAVSTLYLGQTGIAAVALLFATLSHGIHALLVVFLGITSYFWKSVKR